MKTLPAGPQKRITIDPIAIENNRPRVRRHEPVFIVEVEEGDTFVTTRAHRVDMNGPVQTLYGTASGFVRYVTTGEVVLDAEIGETATPAAAPEAPKTKTRKSK